VWLLPQAAAAAQEQQWQLAESFFLKAKRPDAAIATYREAGQWQAALKLAEAYSPNLIQVGDQDVPAARCMHSCRLEQ
jgi:intraflagellar transport protein 172